MRAFLAVNLALAAAYFYSVYVGIDPLLLWDPIILVAMFTFPFLYALIAHGFSCLVGIFSAVFSFAPAPERLRRAGALLFSWRRALWINAVFMAATALIMFLSRLDAPEVLGRTAYYAIIPFVYAAALELYLLLPCQARVTARLAAGR